MFTLRIIFWSIVLFVVSATVVLAAPQGLESTAEEFTAKLSYRQGKVMLPIVSQRSTSLQISGISMQINPGECSSKRGGIIQKPPKESLG